MNYLIVDDEPIAHQVIDRFCSELPFMQKAGAAHNAMHALELIGDRPVDLIFLDIRMPGLGGFELLRTLERPPQVIVISAHEQYALEGFDLNICDYLLKPFSFERFLRAVTKARSLLFERPTKRMAGALERDRSIFFKDGRKYQRVNLDDILFVEASGHFSKVHTTQGNIFSSEKISQIAQRLSEDFLRVHKSFLVAIRQITVIEGDEMLIGSQRIPIGRVYKPEVIRLLKNHQVDS